MRLGTRPAFADLRVGATFKLARLPIAARRSQGYVAICLESQTGDPGQRGSVILRSVRSGAEAPCEQNRRLCSPRSRHTNSLGGSDFWSDLNRTIGPQKSGRVGRRQRFLPPRRLLHFAGRSRFVLMAVPTPKGLKLSSRGQGHGVCARCPRMAFHPRCPTPKGSNRAAGIPPLRDRQPRHSIFHPRLDSSARAIWNVVNVSPMCLIGRRLRNIIAANLWPPSSSAPEYGFLMSSLKSQTWLWPWLVC